MTVAIVDEFEESGPAVDVESGTAKLTREVGIAGGQYESLLADLFGSRTVAGWGFTFGVRAQHPRYNWLRASSAELVGSYVRGDPPHGEDGVRPNERVKIVYTGEVLNSTMGTPDTIDPPTGTFLTYRRQNGIQMMTLPEKHLIWSDGTDVQNNPNAGIVLPIVTHTITWHNVDYPPWTAMDEASGCVNFPDIFGWALGTALFCGYEVELTRDVSGADRFSLTYTFMEMKLAITRIAGGELLTTPITWNHAYRGADADEWTRPWDEYAVRGEEPGWDWSSPVYKSYFFSLLFTPGP